MADQSEMDEFTKATIRGNVDNILKENHSLELSEVGLLEDGSWLGVSWCRERLALGRLQWHRNCEDNGQKENFSKVTHC